MGKKWQVESYTQGEGIMFSLKDRQGKELGLGPTHEEVITQIISQTIHWQQFLEPSLP